MGWVKRTVQPAQHMCCPPMHRTVREVRTPEGVKHNLASGPKPDGNMGDLWKCDKCGVVWKIGIDFAPYVPNSGGYRPRSVQWIRAGWWTQRKYRKV